MGDFMQQAIQAINAGDYEKSRHLLLKELNINPQNDAAWLLMADTMTTDKDRRQCLARALVINPNNQAAQQRLSQLQPQPTTAPVPTKEKGKDNSIQSLLRLNLIFTTALILFIVVGGCVAVTLVFDPNLITSLLGQSQPEPIAAVMQATPTSTFTPIKAVVQTTPTSPTTEEIILPTTIAPTPQPPTSTPTPTSSPSPSPSPTASSPSETFGSAGEIAPQQNVLQKPLLSPETVSEQISDFIGSGHRYYYSAIFPYYYQQPLYSYPGYIPQNYWLCSLVASGQPTKPRLLGQNNGQIQLYNFHPYENVRLYVYALDGNLIGWQTFQVNSLGQLTAQITDGLTADQEYIYVVLSESSGEVVNSIGTSMPCYSIQTVSHVVTQGVTKIEIQNTEQNGVQVSPGTRMLVAYNRRENVDNLWWHVWLEDGTIGRVLDSQVWRELGPIMTPTPPSPAETETPPNTAENAALRPSPEQAVRQYYALIEQRQYGVAWGMLSEYFKSVKNSTGYGDYVEWWDTVKEIELNNLIVLEETADFARLRVDMAYVRFTEPTYYDSGFQIDLIWDQASNQWMFYETKSQ